MLFKCSESFLQSAFPSILHSQFPRLVPGVFIRAELGRFSISCIGMITSLAFERIADIIILSDIGAFGISGR